MSVANLHTVERRWLDAYMPGVPADIEADIEKLL